MAGSISTLSASTFDEVVGSASEPVLVDFWAEWCGPCKMVAPILQEIADEQAGKLKIVKLNVDEAPDVAMKHQVMSIPTLIVFKDGVEVDRLVGARGKAQLLESLAPFL
ncbi:MAG TPA: thioredoxin [Acidimicrobiales bacterium]|nr:thioredoxin [Acidimicrobiales bacterium]